MAIRAPKPPARTHNQNGFWFWKPSTRLRNEGGFKTVALGGDLKSAFSSARALNKRADAWLAATPSTRQPKQRAGTPERLDGITFGAILSRYRASYAYLSLRESTRKTYDKCLRLLEVEFADDRLATLTRARVLAWADPLRGKAKQGLRHYAAVGHAVINWAKDQDLITMERNPFARMKAGPERRSCRVLEEDLKWLVAFADSEGRSDLGTAMVIAFFAVQRLWDVLALTESALHGGGLRLVQSKTKRKIILPTLPQPIAQRVMQYPPRGAYLCHRVNSSGAFARLSEEGAQKAFARLHKRAVAHATAEEGPQSPRAKRLEGLQLRDMRRSGFVFYAQGKKDDTGAITRQPVPISAICAMSGHTISEGMEIVETYLPKTPEQADMAVAMARAKW